MASEGGGRAAILAALLANLGVAVTKFVAFLLTGFSSMLAESIHSVADTGNQLLLLVGHRSMLATAVRWRVDPRTPPRCRMTLVSQRGAAPRARDGRR